MSTLPGIIHRIIKTDKRLPTVSPPEGAHRQPEVVHAHFTLAVYPPDTGEAGIWPTSVKELIAGERYDVAIICEHNHNQFDQEDVMITGDFKLRLVQQFSATVGCKFPYQDFAVKYVDACKPRYELPRWSITIPENLPGGNLTFSLHFKLQHDRYTKENIAPCTLPVRGNMVLEDTQLLDACNIAVGLPEYAAVLAIAYEDQALSPEQYKLIARSRLIGNHDIPLQAQSILGIAQGFPATKLFTILGTVHYFSRYLAGPLMAWFHKLHDACEKRRQRPCLIIVDTTGKAEIPWELLELDDYSFLGAIAQVVRWYPIETYGKSLLLQIEEKIYEGSVLAYLDENLQGVMQEEKALTGVALEKIPTLHALGKRLCLPDGLDRVSLVYISCHGKKGNWLGDTEDLQRPDAGLRSLQEAGLPAYTGQRPLFFVNACESARIRHGDKIDPSSFTESFLAQCASSYIGTTAPVNSMRAAFIAGRILELARGIEGVQIAELLRRLREEVAMKLRLHFPKNDAQAELYKKELFYTFMYVYYGNPLARLRLLPENSAKEDA
jgi:hypothetical protein